MVQNLLSKLLQKWSPFVVQTAPLSIISHKMAPSAFRD
jgi:hypothetical protein